MPVRRLTALALVVLWLVASTAVTVAQGSPAPSPGLTARLPATIDGAPVEIVVSEDLQAFVDTVFAGESHPEIDALEAALAAQGLSLTDVDAVTAYFGADQGGQVQGFAIPGGDAASVGDELVATYLIGLGELEPTQREVGDRTVTFLSEGPLDTSEYPFAILPDAGVLWIVNAELGRVLDAVGALLAVSAGEAPGNTGTAPTPTPAIGPATWFGTMTGTTTWNKGAYVGETSATFRGTLERIEEEGVSYCPFDDCVAYRPMGEVEWTFDSVGVDGNGDCQNHQTGSVSTGEVVIPQDQMLFMQAIAPDHLGYWGSATLFPPTQECRGWEGAGAQGSFFVIPPPEEDHVYADVSGETRPGCAKVDWRIERDATQFTGSCWGYDEPGYEVRYDWDLRRVDPE
jgi:hypothetical protein